MQLFLIEDVRLTGFQISWLLRGNFSPLRGEDDSSSSYYLRKKKNDQRVEHAKTQGTTPIYVLLLPVLMQILEKISVQQVH